jgi:olefin beta-lactone synthetase
MTIPPTHFAGNLSAMARRQPDALAVLCPRVSRSRSRAPQYTYAQLDAESDTLALGLQQVGISRGVRTAFMVPPSLDFFALAFALFKVGAVLVGVDPGMGLSHVTSCFNEELPAKS